MVVVGDEYEGDEGEREEELSDSNVEAADQRRVCHLLT